MLTTLLFCLLPQGEPQDGLALYQQAKYPEAAQAFRQELTAHPDAAELHYNLALAAWRAGDLGGAEEAAERYASAPGGGRADLHRGILGNVRYAEAQVLAQKAAEPPAMPVPVPGQANGTPPNGAQPNGAQPAPPPPSPPDPVALLEQAVAKARTARDEFVRGAAAPQAGPELARNVERALRLIAELEKKLEEAKKQRDEQQKQDQKNDQKNEDQKDKDKKDSDKKDKDKQDGKDEPPKQDDKPKQEPQPKEGEDKPEPKPPEGQERPQPKPEDKPDAKPQPAPEPRNDAPGEQAQPTELSPEQKERLLAQLQQLDQQLKAIRAKARTNKKPVERDW